MFQSIEWEDWISPDAWEDSDPGNLTPCPSLELSVPVTKLHHLGQFTFDNDQLQYLLVNLVWQSNSLQDGIKVLRYKWPNEFSRLSSSDLMTVLESVESHGEAMQ